MQRRHQLLVFGGCAVVLAFVAFEWRPMRGDDRLPFYGPPPPSHDFYEGARGRGIPIRRLDRFMIDPPEPHEIKVHDIVTILVDEKAETTLNSRFDSTRNTTFNAELGEFVRIGDEGNLENAAPNQPAIDFNQQARRQFTGRAIDQEGIRYRIAASVVDVRPNGNLVLEARKSINANQDMWEYSLTGEIRPGDVLPNNTALSENIANLRIDKKSRGRIYGTTRMNWGQKLMNALWPF